MDPDTGEHKASGSEGLLLVKGPILMLGYLSQPEKSAEVLRDGWYITGDIACIDDEGFIGITDRLSRFSKIAGEMVPHLKIEEVMQAVLGDFACAVTGVPDEQKGERLVAFYTRPDLTPTELWQRLAERHFTQPWSPKRRNLHFIEALPTLASGTLDP